MKSSNAIVILLSAIIFFGCNPLKKMIKLAEEKQKITATPSPLVYNGGKVCVEAKVSLPTGMIKKGTSYTVNFTYNDIEVGSIEFLDEIYATRTSSILQLLILRIQLQIIELEVEILLLKL